MLKLKKTRKVSSSQSLLEVRKSSTKLSNESQSLFSRLYHLTQEQELQLKRLNQQRKLFFSENFQYFKVLTKNDYRFRYLSNFEKILLPFKHLIFRQAERHQFIYVLIKGQLQLSANTSLGQQSLAIIHLSRTVGQQQYFVQGKTLYSVTVNSQKASLYRIKVSQFKQLPEEFLKQIKFYFLIKNRAFQDLLASKLSLLQNLDEDSFEEPMVQEKRAELLNLSDCLYFSNGSQNQKLNNHRLSKILNCKIPNPIKLLKVSLKNRLSDLAKSRHSFKIHLSRIGLTKEQSSEKRLQSPHLKRMKRGLSLAHRRKQQ